MAQPVSSLGDVVTVRSPYNLQTQQKRLRHLRSIAVRNLRCGGQMREQIASLQCYFTLHKDNKSPAFYTSEKIASSTNPSWQSFDISRYEDEIDLCSKFFVLRVWVGQHDKFRLLITMEVNLTGLLFLADKLPQSLVKHTPNTVIFGMLDKYFIFISKEQAQAKALARKVADLDVPSSVMPAVIKVEKSAVRVSYNTSSLTRIQTVLRAIKQMQAHARRYRRQIEDRLLASQENTQRLEEREQLLMRVGQLRQELLQRTTQLHSSEERYQAKQDGATARGEKLGQDRKTTESNWRVLSEDKKDYIGKREHYLKENALLSLRQRQMVTELVTYIYPITEKNGKFYINGVHLPHAEAFQGQDEIMISVALGYTCHLIIKIAQILGQPLRHPMENRGSRSVIYDQVHSKLNDKDREFPLYAKGRDKFHFNYGVFLLNKNISQLRYLYTQSTPDLRQTLQNLQGFLQRMGVRTDGEAAASYSAFETPGMPITTSMSNSLASHTSGVSISSAVSASSANGEVTRVSEAQEKERLTSKSSAKGVSPSGATPNGKANTDVHKADEADEMFEPSSEDNFFSGGNSFFEDFNEGQGPSLKASKKELQADGNEDRSEGAEGSQDSNRNCQLSETQQTVLGESLNQILQTASAGENLTPTRSFKLVSKQSNSGNDQASENNSRQLQTDQDNGDDDFPDIYSNNRDSSVGSDDEDSNGDRNSAPTVAGAHSIGDSLSARTDSKGGPQEDVDTEGMKDDQDR